MKVISCHIVRPVVQQLIVELDQCTVRRQNSRHHRHTNRTTRADPQPLEMASIRWPKTSSSSHEWVAGRKTRPRVIEPAKANFGFNAPNFSRNCSLFVWLQSPDTGRPRLRQERQLL